MATYAIVSAVIKKDNKYLIAKRANTKRFAPGEWEFISGFMDVPGSAEENILREIKEELNVDAKVIKTAPVFQFDDKEGTWVVIPLLVELKSLDIKINPHDHSEVKWVTLNEINTFKDLKPFMNNADFRSLID